MTNQYPGRIRAARASDIAAITDIYNEAVHDRVATCDLSDVPPDRRAAWLAGHRHPHGVWVAVSENAADDDVVGWVALSRYDSKPCFHRTATFATYVRRRARGTGVGTALRAFMIDVARERGLHTLVNRVWATNTASIALARRFGFVQVAHLRELVDLDGEFVDCLLFQLMLGPDPAPATSAGVAAAASGDGR